jgi:hypothetical protein
VTYPLRPLTPEGQWIDGAAHHHNPIQVQTDTYARTFN